MYMNGLIEDQDKYRNRYLEYQMRANEFINEAKLGVASKRPERPGSRPPRGHEPMPAYKEEPMEDFDLDEAGKASRALCLSKKSNDELGASQLSSCKSQGLRKRETKRKFRVGNKVQKVQGKRVKGAQYGGPIPRWKGN